MKPIHLRTAAIAGTCAVALSFVSIPAWAGTSSVAGAGVHVAASSSHDDDDTAEDESADDSVTGVDDDAENEDESDDAADDAAGSGLPTEQGTPVLRLSATTLSPAVFAKRGISAVVSGLTPGVRYQPFWSSGQMGDAIRSPRKADGKGVLRFEWKPSKALAAKPGSWIIGVGGVDTDMANVTQTLDVKYDSDLTWEGAVRHGRTVTLTVSLDRQAGSGKDAAWKKVPVDFQKQVGDQWVTVKSKRTNGEGFAKVTVKSDATTVWRAVVGETRSTDGSRTKGRRA